MTVSESSISTRVCPKCSEGKPLTKEFWFPESMISNSFKKHACRVCINIARRESCREYARQRRSTEEGRIAAKASKLRWNALNPDKVREWNRKHYERKAAREGREYRPAHGRQRDVMPWVKARAARIAFRKFIDESSDEEVKCWYAAIGKPWINPRLTAAEKDKVRHQFDSEYHIKRRLYYRDRKTKRRFFVKAENDGTLSPEIIKQATHCLYCGDKFSSTCKPTLDHLIPVKKGGSHSAANVVVCCLSCNSRKGAMDFLDWIDRLAEPYRTRAARAWRQLRGAPPQQQALIG